MSGQEKSQIRSWMTQRFAIALGVPEQQVDIHCSFKNFGIDSIELLILTGEFADWFGTELGAETFWKYDSIASVSDYLEKAISDGTVVANIALEPSASVTERISKADNLYCIRLRDGESPLFLIHDLSGNTTEYLSMVEHLEDSRPIYGIHDDPSLEADIEIRAQQYVQVIQQSFPQGPYYLMGYCFGGVMAYEMARQMHNQGCEVAFLGLLDIAPPATYMDSTLERVRLLPRFILNALLFSGAMLMDYLRNLNALKSRLTSLRQRFRKSLARTLLNSNERKKQKILDSHAQIASGMPSAYQDSAKRNLSALRSYVPGPYLGKVHLVRSYSTTFCRKDALWQWEKYINKSDIQSFRASGSHLRMMHAPHVVRIAHFLNQGLR